MPASLTRRDVGGRRPDGLVLMLHGGKADGLTPVEDGSASWRRSRWMMDHVHGRMNRAGVSVWLLRYSLHCIRTPTTAAPWKHKFTRRSWSAARHRSSLG